MQVAEKSLELRDYFGVLRRRRNIVALVALVVVGVALVSSLLQTDVYRAKAELLLQPRSTESLFDPQTGQANDPDRAVQTEIKVLKSRPVETAVRDQLGATPKVSVSPAGQTDVIDVSAESTDPEQAAIVANAYANAYIDFRRRQAVDDVLAATREIQGKVIDLQREIDATDPRAVTQRDTLVQQQALFKQRLDQLRVDAALKTGGAQLVTPAVAPESPVKPKPLRNAVVALFVGLVFGVGMAFLVEYLDDSIKTKEDLEQAAAGLPTVGLIPAVPAWRDRRRALIVSLSEPKSPPAEAYRALRTSIQFLGHDHPLGAILVTSPSAGEGKTTTLANLAVALAQAGQRVAVLSCDLRRPRIHEFFGVGNDVGFTSLVLGTAPLSEALQPAAGVDGVAVMASGPVPPNPAELLASRRAVEVLTALRSEADVVLVDSPPVLPVTDAAVLSSRVDGTLLVATAGVTTRREMERTHELLRQVDARILGCVLNGVTGEGGYGYAYSYQYAYASAAEGDGRRGWRPSIRA